MELNNRAMSENPKRDVNQIKGTNVNHLSGDLKKARIASENTNQAIFATSDMVPSHSNRFLTDINNTRTSNNESSQIRSSSDMKFEEKKSDSMIEEEKLLEESSVFEVITK